MKHIKYIFFVLLGGTLYGTMSSFVKLSYSNGYTAAEISFMQAALAAVFLGVIALATKKGVNGKATKKDIGLLILTGSAIGTTNYLYYQSVNYIPASLSIVILMQFTWISLLLAWIISGEKPSRIALITVFFILAGTVMAADVPGAKTMMVSGKGIACALLASLTYALYIVANGRAGRNVRWQSKSAWIMAGSAVTIFLVSSKAILAENHFSSEFMLWAIFFAVVGTTIPTALFAGSIPKVGAGISAILMTVELPVAVICASVVLHERIRPIQLAGIIIMLAAICLMNYFRSLKTKEEN